MLIARVTGHSTAAPCSAPETLATQPMQPPSPVMLSTFCRSHACAAEAAPGAVTTAQPPVQTEAQPAASQPATEQMPAGAAAGAAPAVAADMVPQAAQGQQAAPAWDRW